MRCPACDKVLSTAEMMAASSDRRDDLCWTCFSAAFSEYNILSDKEYQHGYLAISDNFQISEK